MKNLRGDLASAVLAVALLAGSLFQDAVATRAMAQSFAERVNIVVDKTVVIDADARRRGFDGEAVTIVIRLALSAEPLLNAAVSTGEPGDNVSTYTLTGTLSSLDSNVYWTGTLRRRIAAEGTRLGPVLFADAKGLRAEALREIAALVRQNLHGEGGPLRRLTRVRAVCFSGADAGTQSVADEARAVVRQLLRRDLAVSDGALEPIACKIETPASVAIGGNVTRAGGEFRLTPEYRQGDAGIPLPVFVGQSLVDPGTRYVPVLLEAIRAAHAGYAPQQLEAAKEARLPVLRRLADEAPYLALAVLQRSQLENAETYREIGKALRLVRDFGAAEQHQRRAIELSPSEPEGYRELAMVYFDQQRFGEALVPFS